MKMILVLMGCLYFFAPPALATMGMRVLAFVLIFRLAFELPSMMRHFLGRPRIM